MLPLREMSIVCNELDKLQDKKKVAEVLELANQLYEKMLKLA